MTTTPRKDTLLVTDDRFDGRYSVFVTHEPWDENDPIAWLATIYDAGTDEKVAAYWRGTQDEAVDALTEWVDERERA